MDNIIEFLTVLIEDIKSNRIDNNRKSLLIDFYHQCNGVGIVDEDEKTLLKYLSIGWFVSNINDNKVN